MCKSGIWEHIHIHTPISHPGASHLLHAELEWKNHLLTKWDTSLILCHENDFSWSEIFTKLSYLHLAFIIYDKHLPNLIKAIFSFLPIYLVFSYQLTLSIRIDNKMLISTQQLGLFHWPPDWFPFLVISSNISSDSDSKWSP